MRRSRSELVVQFMLRESGRGRVSRQRFRDMLMPSTKGESKKDFAPARLFTGQDANGRADLL
jgi:hypothetical protein